MVVGYWLCWWQSGGSGVGDSPGKGSSRNSCSTAIVKCMLCGGVVGCGGIGGSCCVGGQDKSQYNHC